MFLKEEKDKQYNAYTEFDRIIRDKGALWITSKYIRENRHNRLWAYIILTDAVLASKILTS